MAEARHLKGLRELSMKDVKKWMDPRYVLRARLNDLQARLNDMEKETDALIKSIPNKYAPTEQATEGAAG